VKIRNIPVEVQSVTVKTRDGAVSIVAKLCADVSRRGSGPLRSFVRSHVVPRPEVLDAVSLEGLDLRERSDLTPDEAERLDVLMRRRTAAIKVSCAPPTEWWHGCEVTLRSGEDADAALTLRPAGVDGRVVVAVTDEAASVTFSWSCLAALVDGDLATVAGLIGAGMVMDLASDSMQLDLFAEGADAVADAARSFVRTVRDAGASARIEVPGRVVELFPENAKPDDDRLN